LQASAASSSETQGPSPSQKVESLEYTYVWESTSSPEKQTPKKVSLSKVITIALTLLF